jgi:hypothetical protein
MKKKLHQHLRDQTMDRWLARGAVIVIAALQTVVVNDLSFGPWWLGPAVELALLVPLSAGTLSAQRSAARAETDEEWDHVGSKRLWVRRLAAVLTAVSTVLNCAALFLLTRAIFQGHAGSGRALLLDAINIWATNVIIFALWYWTLDRGSPSSRGLVAPDQRDFGFTQQMQDPTLFPGCTEWSPGFVDYIFLAFTNATAFSPADTMPMTARAKLLMMAESTISLVTIAIVASRAVGILS